MMTIHEEQMISRLIEKLDDVSKRVVRIESKLSQMMEEQGIRVGALRPEWKHGTIILPSLACTTKALVSVIPSDWPFDEEIFVLFEGEHVLSVFKGE